MTVEIDVAKKEKMIRFCDAIFCIAKGAGTFEGDAIKAIVIDVSNWIESLGKEKKND